MLIELNDANFEQEVLNSTGVVLVDFWATWCRPCVALSPIIAELAEDYSGKAKVCKFNIEQGERFPAEFQVMAVPTILFFKDGKLADKVVGALPKQKFVTKIESLL